MKVLMLSNRSGSDVCNFGNNHSFTTDFQFNKSVHIRRKSNLLVPPDQGSYNIRVEWRYYLKLFLCSERCVHFYHNAEKRPLIYLWVQLKGRYYSGNQIPLQRGLVEVSVWWKRLKLNLIRLEYQRLPFQTMKVASFFVLASLKTHSDPPVNNVLKLTQIFRDCFCSWH